jgi:hypothetical protein
MVVTHGPTAYDRDNIRYEDFGTTMTRLTVITGDNTGTLSGFKTITGPGTGNISGFDNLTNTGYGGTLRSADLITRGPWVDVRAYGAVGDNVTSDLTAFQNAANAAAGGVLFIPEPSIAYYVPGTITTSSNTTIIGAGRPLIRTNSTTLPIFQGGAVTNVTISGLRLQGGGSGGGAGDVGLIDINTAAASGVSDIRIFNNEISNFRNGITAVRVQNLWIEENLVHNFLLYGIMASLSYNFHIDRNNVYTCDQAGAANAYGIMATGDEGGGMPSKRCSISFNHIDSIPSWDGIMTHDVDGLQIIGNDIRDVRIGLDIGHSDNTNIIKNIIISGNFIESTATDTWSAAAATHGGILVDGLDNTHLVSNVTVTGNIVKDFFNITGLVTSGDSSNITVSNTGRAAIVGNSVVGTGSEVSNAGIYIVGDCDGVTITGNSIQGTMVSGGIRFASATCDTVVVSGNSIVQDNTADVAVWVSGSTLSDFAYYGNATNSTSPYSAATSTISLRVPRLLTATAALNFDLTTVAFHDLTVNVVGAELGDVVAIGIPHGSVTDNIVFTAWASAENYVTVRAASVSGTHNPASGTFRVDVYKH